MPHQREEGPAPEGVEAGAHHYHHDNGHQTASASIAAASQQVAWSDVHAWVLPKLQIAGDWPMLGTPLWRELADGDRVKWASILDAAQHWALRIEHFQRAECEASHAISGGEDWTAIARFIKGRTDYFAARPWLNRRDGR